ncbi:unnamed protein product [Ixodes persulcatus]
MMCSMPYISAFTSLLSCECSSIFCFVFVGRRLYKIQCSCCCGVQSLFAFKLLVYFRSSVTGCFKACLCSRNLFNPYSKGKLFLRSNRKGCAASFEPKSLCSSKCVHTEIVGARKVRRHREKKMAEPVRALASTLVITKDNAALELQTLGSANLTGVTHNMGRIRVLLELALPDRRNVHMDPLPQYFLVEEILCMEVEVRFQWQVVVLEKRLTGVVRVFSESQGNESTLLDIMNYLQRNMGHKLLNEAPLLEGELQVTAPHIHTNSEGTCIFAASEAEVVRLSTGSLERALIMCLITYYIKSLEYPYAFSQMLLLV